MENRSDDLTSFSVADSLLDRFDDAWEPRKLRGNELFNAGDFEGAAACYGDAARVALGPLRGGAIKAFQKACDTRPAGSASHRFDELIIRSVFAYIKFPPAPIRFDLGSVPPEDRPSNNNNPNNELYICEEFPNKPAAVALANRSAAFLKAGRPKAALAEAVKATQFCPEYVKGHRRVAHAYKALDEKEKAKQKLEEIRVYELTRDKMPYHGAALLGVGWITWEQSALVYEPTHRREGCKRIHAAFQEPQGETDDYENNAVGLSCSLVPFQDAQCLMIGVRYKLDFFSHRKIDCLEFHPLDQANAGLLDLPPHGKPSKLALERAPEIIAFCVERLQDDSKFKISSVMCCQGLVEQVELIKHRLQIGGFTGVKVTPAASTRVSEDAGISPSFSSLMAAMGPNM